MCSLWRPAAIAAALGVSFAAGCVATGERTPTEVALPIASSLYTVTGRLSARHGTEGLSANFQWRHDRDQDELELSSPLGQTVARLTGNADGVRMIAADGRVETAGDWQVLTTRGLGWPLPIAGLAYWVQGAPREGAPFAVEAGAGGTPALLRQDGWTIVYGAFMLDAGGVARPSRVTLNYADVEIRLAIDAWQ